MERSAESSSNLGLLGQGSFVIIIIIILQIYGAMEVCPVRNKEASWRKLRSQARLACLEKSTLALCDGILPKGDCVREKLRLKDPRGHCWVSSPKPQFPLVHSAPDQASRKCDPVTLDSS